jgi:hypothetical protein
MHSAIAETADEVTIIPFGTWMNALRTYALCPGECMRRPTVTQVVDIHLMEARMAIYSFRLVRRTDARVSVILILKIIDLHHPDEK